MHCGVSINYTEIAAAAEALLPWKHNKASLWKWTTGPNHPTHFYMKKVQSIIMPTHATDTTLEIFPKVPFGDCIIENILSKQT